MYITQDFYNNTSAKSKFVLAWFRLCQLILKLKFKPFRLLLSPIILIYRIVVDWFLGIDLHPALSIGSGLAIYHGQGLVVGKGSIIGRNCLLRHGVTIGRKINKDGTKTKDPVIGDDVEFGANSCVIGDIYISNHSIIGAGAVVTKSLEEGTVIVTAAPRILKGGYKIN